MHRVIALQVVKRRGESMAAAAKIGKAHGMLSVIGLDDEAMEDVCSKARAAAGADAVCQIANYLFPTGRVVSGHKSALDEARSRSRPRKPGSVSVTIRVILETGPMRRHCS